MKDMINTQLRQEIENIVNSHHENMKRCANPNTMVEDTADPILNDLKSLSLLCEYPAEDASVELFHNAYHAKQALEVFLKTMNQDLDDEFAETELGRIWGQANRWCEVAKRNFQMPFEKVWSFIKPAEPDCLIEQGNGLFTAKWWTPVPMMDIEILRRTDGIRIREEYDDPEYAGMRCIDFSVVPARTLKAEENR